MALTDLAIGAALRLAGRGKLTVFAFHGITVEKNSLSEQLTLADFEKVIYFVSKRFVVLPLDQAAKRLQQDKLPPGAASITFDDGYSNWLDGATAVLEKNNLHATFFITTGQFCGLPLWHERVSHAVSQLSGPFFDIPGFGLPKLPLGTLAERQRVYVLVQDLLKYQSPADQLQSIAALERVAGILEQPKTAMGIAQLRAIANRGFGIGAHTVTHPILRRCDRATAVQEIGFAREFLQGATGFPITGFAYPNGRPLTDFGHEHVDMVKAAGFTHAVTTHRSAARGGRTSVFEIPRFTPWGPSHRQMALQTIRNMVTRPKFSQPNEPKKPLQSPVVLYVENGSGFGGAIVALKTLLAHRNPNSPCHLVLNLAVSDFTQIKSVASQTIIPDQVVDLSKLVSAVRALGWGRFGRLILFAIGRIDDLANRLPYIFRLWLLALKIRPDVIHGNNEPGSNREAMIVAKLMGIPYVQHLRGPLGPLRHASWLLAQPQAFIPVSRWLAGQLSMAGVSACRVRHVYDGVEFQGEKAGPPCSTLRPQIGLPENCTLVAMVGMLVTWKGQDDFIDAVNAVHLAYPDTFFLIVGDAPELHNQNFSTTLKHQVAKLGLSDRIIFTGRRADLVKILPQIDIVVSASKMPEPLGLVMLEAMAAECVFIGPAHGAVPEVVIDGENGYTFLPNSSQSLALALKTALDGLNSDKPIRRRARTAVEASFSGQRCDADTAMVYQSIMPCLAA